MRLRPILILTALAIAIAFLAFRIEIAVPGTPPSLYNTFTPLSQAAPKGIGSYDVLGYVVDADEAKTLLATPEGQAQLSPENGAVAITEDLINLGRKDFYTETFGNEAFITDVTGALDGPLNPVNLSKAILALGGQPTRNLQVTLDQDITVGGQTFAAGTILNTGIDVPAGSLLPLGIRTSLSQGKVKIGITCAFCHAAVDENTGRILEGAPNNDLDTGLILAMASNSAAWFRQTGVNPTQVAAGGTRFINSEGEEETLAEIQTLEDAVDADLLSWPPGNFDSTGDLKNNPSQIPSSYTHEAWPYGWNGFAAIGWFHGLTTLNSNVHAVNSDLTTGADGSPKVWGISKDVYLGTMLQNASNPKFRLPAGANPSEFFDKIDPTPGTPGLNQVVTMPNYPQGSLFMLEGLIAGSPGLPFGAQLNGLSAWQNTLSPPAYLATNVDVLQRGADVFNRAGCVECHRDRYFTNHQMIPQPEIGTQPLRAKALAAFPAIFDPPQTYPSNTSVPLPPNPTVLSVPTEITPERSLKLAYNIDNPAGGYKVPSLIGLHVTAPYLHDGGVAAGAEALKLAEDGYYTVANSDQMGLVTAINHAPPDAAASLRVLVDRKLRESAIASNRANPDLQRTHVEGIGHNYWVDKEAGFNPQEQTDLIQFLLSLDDNPDVLPEF